MSRMIASKRIRTVNDAPVRLQAERGACPHASSPRLLVDGEHKTAAAESRFRVAMRSCSG